METPAININSISKNIPTPGEIRRNLEREQLKTKLGLYELFDGDPRYTTDDLHKAGFTNFLDYDTTRLQALQLLNNNQPLPNNLTSRLLLLESILESKNESRPR